MSEDKSSTYPEFEERLRFETLIADLSSKVVNLPTGEVDREIMKPEQLGTGETASPFGAAAPDLMRCGQGLRRARGGTAVPADKRVGSPLRHV